MDKIFIKGLALQAIIGIYPHERVTKQPVIFDIEVLTDISKPAASGLIEDAVDYAMMAERVEEMVSGSEFLLLESLIVYVVDTLLHEFKVAKITCTAYKPQAVECANTVGISITRTQCG